MINIGIIGYGYWGPNLMRNFMETPGANVAAISDLSEDRLNIARQRNPMVTATQDYRELIQDPKIDAIVIATSVSSHFKLAMEALQNGKHVLVEKPMTATSSQAKRLVDEADRRGLTLLVDHTFAYTGAVRKMKDLISSGSLGDIYYYDSVRVNLGLFQHDVNVLWDLAVHDLAIMSYVLPSAPVAVSATGISHIPGRPENIAYMTLFFEENLIAHVHVNWLAPVKVRQTMIGGSQRMVVYDDIEPSEKIKIYDKGVTVNGNTNGNGNGQEKLYQMLISYRAGDMWAPKLDITEALRVEAKHFLNCIETGETPETSGEAGLRVVNILEAATRSLRERGKIVRLNKGTTQVMRANAVSVPA